MSQKKKFQPSLKNPPIAGFVAVNPPIVPKFTPDSSAANNFFAWEAVHRILIFSDYYNNLVSLIVLFYPSCLS